MCEDEAEVKVPHRPSILLGTHLDGAIEASRQHTLSLCIRKAKAEAAGLLNFPLEELQSFVLW